MDGITVAGLSSGPSHLEVRHQQRTIPRNQELQPGCILWLPNKAEINEHLLIDVDISDGCFNHPVVVLSTNLDQGKATVFILTSFNGQTLAEKYPENYRLQQRSHHLPIFPSAAHPDNGTLLYLDSDVPLPKKSYVKTEVKVILNVASLLSYRHRQSGRQFKLKQSSYHKLAVYVKLDPPTTESYLPTPPQTPLQTNHHAPPQTPSPSSYTIPNGSPGNLSDSTAQRNAHAPLLAAIYPPVRTAPRIPPNPPSRAPQPPQPYNPPSTTPPQIDYHQRQCHRYDPPSREPPPEPLVLADLVPLLLLGSLGAAIYWRSRLSFLGKWALAVVREKGRW